MAREAWSFKEDRRLMELAKSSTSLEEAAKQPGARPVQVKRMALRLGLSLKSRAPRRISGPLAPAVRASQFTDVRVSRDRAVNGSRPIDATRPLSALSISPRMDGGLSGNEIKVVALSGGERSLDWLPYPLDGLLEECSHVVPRTRRSFAPGNLPSLASTTQVPVRSGFFRTVRRGAPSASVYWS